MVENLSFAELLRIEDVAQRSDSLRRAFSPFTALVDVSGYETQALIVLLNLTFPKVKIPDLLLTKQAKVTVKDDKHINECVHEVAWLHSHNLKYPEIRVSLERIIAPMPIAHPYVLSSANCDRALGWSHDSAKVNKSKLFGSHFIWQGQTTCLGRLLVDCPAIWKGAFQKLGMPVKRLVTICEKVAKLLPEVYFPRQVDRRSTQVLMPYHDGYVAITPVVNHALQAEIQRVALSNQCRSTTLLHARPASTGDLAAALGGRIRALNYPPKISDMSFGFGDSRLSLLQGGRSVFNDRTLHQSNFKAALEGLLTSGLALAVKLRRQQRVASLRQIRAVLLEWFAPILDWRSELETNRFLLQKLDGFESTLEYSLLTVNEQALPELLKPLFRSFNETLADSRKLNQFAYHQKLMPPLRHQLKWLLANISGVKLAATDSEPLMQRRYIHLKQLRAFNAQALSNPYCVGVPSLTAVWGMLHNYQRKLNQLLGTQVGLDSFAWFISRYSTVLGRTLPEYSMEGPKQDNFRRAGFIDTKHCDVEFDLVVHVSGFEEDLVKLDDAENRLKASLPSTFAGGTLLPPELSRTSEWCNISNDEHGLFDELKRLPSSGKWVMPSQHKMSSIAELSSLLSQQPELCPTMLGYLLLEQPKQRPNALIERHAYAEPAIGLVECSTAIQTRLKGQNHFFRQAFWMLDAQEHFMLMKRI